MIQESENHEKIVLPPSTMLNPTPVVMVSCAGKNPLLPQERPNIVTIAWAGTVCSEPPMVTISVRPSRHSYNLIKDTQEFVINLVNENLLKACDYCGVRSGEKEDKFASMSLTSVPAEGLEFAPAILESPLSLACKVVSSTELGTHTMFVANIVGITADMNLFDKEGKLCLEDSKLIAYSHGEYYALGKILGFFGHSVASPEVLARRMKEKAAKEKEQAALDLAASIEVAATQAEVSNADDYQKPDYKKSEFKKSRYSVSGPRKPGFSKSDEGSVSTGSRKPGFSRSGSASHEGGYSSFGPRKGGYSGSQRSGSPRPGPRDSRSFAPREGAGSGPRDSRSFAPREGASSGPRDSRSFAPREGAGSGSRDSRSFTPREGAGSGPRDSRSSAPREGGYFSSGPRKSGYSSGQKPGFSRSGPRDSGSRDSGPRESGSRESHSFAPRENRGSGFAPREGGFSSSGPRTGAAPSSAPRKPGFSKPGFRKPEQGRDRAKQEGGRGRFDSSK